MSSAGGIPFFIKIKSSKSARVRLGYSCSNLTRTCHGYWPSHASGTILIAAGDVAVNIWTKDRHKVRSKSEVKIDDWLFDHKIAHVYEEIVKVDTEEMLCDFLIPTEKENEYIYIEFWGRNEEKYIQRKEHKKSVYKKGNLKLIELYPRDLEKLDQVLTQKLKSPIL